MSGDRPEGSARLGFAPAFRRLSTIFAPASAQATSSGVMPRSFNALTFAPALISASIRPRSSGPPSAAPWRRWAARHSHRRGAAAPEGLRVPVHDRGNQPRVIVGGGGWAGCAKTGQHQQRSKPAARMALRDIPMSPELTKSVYRPRFVLLCL